MGHYYGHETKNSLDVSNSLLQEATKGRFSLGKQPQLCRRRVARETDKWNQKDFQGREYGNQDRNALNEKEMEWVEPGTNWIGSPRTDLNGRSLLVCMFHWERKTLMMRADPQILKCNDDYYFQRSQRHSESGYKESSISLVFSNQIKKLENILCHVCDLSARAYHTPWGAWDQRSLNMASCWRRFTAAFLAIK